MERSPNGSDLARGLSVLRDRDFRWFFAGQCTSMLGDGMVAPALAFAVLDLTGRVSDLGAILAVGAGSQVLFMLAGGVIADRLPRQALIVGSDVVRAAGQGLAATLLITGHARIWELLVFQVVHGVAAALSLPALPGVVQAITRPEQRQPANALRVLALSASLLTGPALAGALVVAAGPGWAIAIDAATFAASAACVSRMRVPRAGPAEVRRFARDLADGWREFRSRRWVWSVIAAASVLNLLYAAFSVLGPVVSARSLGGAGAWAAISAMFGAGCLGGGLIALCVRPRFPLRSGVTVMAGFACPNLALAAGLAAHDVAAAAFCGGLVMMLFNTLWETTLQQHIPPNALCRVSAYEWAGAIACQPLGLALVAPVAGRFGTHATLWFAGTLQVLAALAPLAFPEVRTLPSPPGDHAVRAPPV